MLRIKKITNRRKKKEKLRKAAKDMLPDVCPKCGHHRATDKGLKIVCRRCNYILLRYRDLDIPKEKKEVKKEEKPKTPDPDAKGLKKIYQWLNSS
jgi:uncharacterized Zn finger protein (UPF0148 family)